MFDRWLPGCRSITHTASIDKIILSIDNFIRVHLFRSRYDRTHRILTDRSPLCGTPPYRTYTYYQYIKYVHAVLHHILNSYAQYPPLRRQLNSTLPSSMIPCKIKVMIYTISTPTIQRHITKDNTTSSPTTDPAIFDPLCKYLILLHVMWVRLA